MKFVNFRGEDPARQTAPRHVPGMRHEDRDVIGAAQRFPISIGDAKITCYSILY